MALYISLLFAIWIFTSLHSKFMNVTFSLTIHSVVYNTKLQNHSTNRCHNTGDMFFWNRCKVKHWNLVMKYPMSIHITYFHTLLPNIHYMHLFVSHANSNTNIQVSPYSESEIMCICLHSSTDYVSKKYRSQGFTVKWFHTMKYFFNSV